MAAMWLFSVAAGIVQGCLPSTRDGLVSHAAMETGATVSHTVVADLHSSHHEDSLAACVEHCERSAVSVIKFIQQDAGQLAALVLTFYLLVHVAAMSSPMLRLPSWLFSFGIVCDPPATIRYHHFNN
ncbi:MAG: hypothetical protein ABI476_06255 [Oxalobacteraceae bacterium]